MSEHFGPIEICCDAPAYAVVRSCRLLGFHAPEDVRWCRLHRHVPRPAGPHPAGLFGLLKAAVRALGPGEGCSCGAPLPALRGVRMTFNTGETVSYFLGQCDRCHTIFWDEP
jgi:hypothetical protein